MARLVRLRADSHTRSLPSRRVYERLHPTGRVRIPVRLISLVIRRGRPLPMPPLLEGDVEQAATFSAVRGPLQTDAAPWSLGGIV